MSALEDRLRRFAYEWNEAMNRPYTVNMMPMLRKAASDVRSLVAPSSEAEFKQETCHEVVIDRFFRGCGECGYMWEYMYGIGKREPPKFCPNCGAKIVEPTTNDVDAEVDE